MSKNDAKVSNKEQGEQKNDSVYDFLYYDRQRVGAFLAQFDDSGHLQQIKESEHAVKAERRSFKLNLSGGATVLGTGGQGGVGLERGPGQQGGEGTERVYDPLWANALTFLDYLETANLMCRDIAKGRLGEFVLVSGRLSVLDLGLLPPFWKSPSMKRVMDDWAKNQSTAQKLESGKQTVAATSRLTLDILPTLPHSSQCKIEGENFAVWSTLSPENMVGTVADLSLKHGTHVAGTWNLLGILDALPDKIPELRAFPESGASQPIESLIKNISNLSRMALGRPEAAYGMTALLLFRQVSAGAN